MADRQIWLNGQLVPADQARISVYDHGLLYGDGVFEGIRAYNGRILKLASHLRRLFEGGRSIALEVPYDASTLERAIRDTLDANAIRDGYIRLCVTRGTGTLGLSPYRCEQPSVFVIADTISLYPDAFYEEGMSIITAGTVRNHPASISPRVKSLNYLNNILAKIEAINAGVHEALMLNHLGYVAECTGDNVFMVRSGREGPELLTPPLHAGILEGITRNLVMDLAAEEGYPVREMDLTRHDLFASDEMFLTGTAAEIIPITQIDARPVGTGRPGSLTQRLIRRYRDLMESPPED